MSVEFSADLQLSDFKAEEVTDDSVWVKKSHDPKWNLNNRMHKSNKVICCVRNPYDTLASLMNFFPTLIHSGQLQQNFSDFGDVWDKLVKEGAEALKIYHERVLKEMKPAVPTLFVRYEDLRTAPQKTLEEIFTFILGRDIEGLNVQKRITEIVNLGHKATVSYTQKVKSDDKITFNRHISQFSEKQ